jgi:acyl carrier protein
MDRKEIEKKVIKSASIVLKKDVSTITEEARFKEDLKITSMKVVMLTALLEDEFNKKFPMARVLKNQTIRDCVDMVVETLAAEA